MKLMHLADLHIGKRLLGFSLLEDQVYIMKKLLELAEEEKPDAVLIAGDVYDRSAPPAEAVAAFDDFLTGLAETGAEIFIISGNHDSAERIAYGGRLLDRSGVHLSRVYDGQVVSAELQDEYGPVRFHLLPFVRPGDVRSEFPDAKIETFEDAVRTAVDAIPLDPAVRNVLLAHVLVTGVKTESEELWIGGIDNVGTEVFDAYDYVALGHIHRPQCAGRESLRYSGTPLKYATGDREIEQTKSVPIVTLGPKGTEPEIRLVPLTPLREMAAVRGSFEDILYGRNVQGAGGRPPEECFLRVTLTDEEDIPDAAGKLRTRYPYLLQLEYDNARTRNMQTAASAESAEELPPEELFAELYRRQNGRELDDFQAETVAELVKNVWRSEL